jgi:hypothetical protein
MSDLYDRDILEWSERQAERLRRHAAGERINDTDLDWVRTNISRVQARENASTSLRQVTRQSGPRMGEEGLGLTPPR